MKFITAASYPRTNGGRAARRARHLRGSTDRRPCHQACQTSESSAPRTPPLPPGTCRWATRVAVFLLALTALVHVGWLPDHAVAQSNGKAQGKSPEKAQKKSPVQAKTDVPQSAQPLVRTGIDDLPAPVLEMREAILAAVQSGKIADLRIALEMNELPPVVADGAVGDPIAHWRQLSADGEGYEILAIVADLLASSYAVLPLGADLENNRVYVWPALAELPLDKLAPAQQVELMRLVPATSAKEMIASKRYVHYRIGIGADGTWHYFKK